jgi:hypothetical protein
VEAERAKNTAIPRNSNPLFLLAAKTPKECATMTYLSAARVIRIIGPAFPAA